MLLISSGHQGNLRAGVEEPASKHEGSIPLNNKVTTSSKSKKYAFASVKLQAG